MLRQESLWTKVSGFSEPELLKQQGKAEERDEKLWECYCNQKQTGQLPLHWTFLGRNSVLELLLTLSHCVSFALAAVR